MPTALASRSIAAVATATKLRRHASVARNLTVVTDRCHTGRHASAAALSTPGARGRGGAGRRPRRGAESCWRAVGRLRACAAGFQSRRRHHPRRLRVSSSTSPVPSVAPASIGCRRDRGSRTRLRAPAARLAKASLDGVNLAAPLADGEQVVVPARTPSGAAAVPAAARRRASSGPVSLSTATAEQLDALPGHRPGDSAEDRRLPRRSTARSTPSTSSTRSPASAPPSSTSSAAWWCRDGGAARPCSTSQLLVGAACVGIAAANLARVHWTGIAGVAIGSSLLAAVAACPTSGCWSRALAVPPRRLVLGQRAARRDRPQPADAVCSGRPSTPRSSSRLHRARPGSRSASRPSCTASAGSSVSEPVLLELPAGRPPAQGDVLDVLGVLAPPKGPEHGFDERTYLRRHGIHVVLRGDRWRVVGPPRRTRRVADGIRAFVTRGLSRGSAGEQRAVLLGVVLGADEGLSQGLRDRFRASGLYHLLAVSGQNVALVAGGALLVAWLAGIPRLVGELGALAAIAAYVLAVGAQPSVVRAGIAGALGSIAWLLARERDRWWFLLVGAFVLLAWNPYTLLDAGFQLSFAAVVAIFTLAPRLGRVARGLPAAPEGRGLPRRLDRVRPGNGADPLAPVPRRPAPGRACERARCPGGRPAPRPRAGRGGRPSAGTIRRRGAHLARRLVRRLPRVLRAADRRPPVRADPLGLRGSGDRPRCCPGRNLCLEAMPEQTLKPVYLLSGSDRPKVERAVERLRSHFDPDAVERLFAAETSGDEAVAACNALGLFGGGSRLVLVDGVDRWKAADVKAIADYLRSPTPDTVLALVAGEELKKDSPLAKACAKARRRPRLRHAQAQSARVGRRAVLARGREGRAGGMPAARRARRRRPVRPRERGRRSSSPGLTATRSGSPTSRRSSPRGPRHRRGRSRTPGRGATRPAC